MKGIVDITLFGMTVTSLSYLKNTPLKLSPPYSPVSIALNADYKPDTFNFTLLFLFSSSAELREKFRSLLDRVQLSGSFDFDLLNETGDSGAAELQRSVSEVATAREGLLVPPPPVNRSYSEAAGERDEDHPNPELRRSVRELLIRLEAEARQVRVIFL